MTLIAIVLRAHARKRSKSNGQISRFELRIADFILPRVGVCQRPSRAIFSKGLQKRMAAFKAG